MEFFAKYLIKLRCLPLQVLLVLLSLVFLAICDNSVAFAKNLPKVQNLKVYDQIETLQIETLGFRVSDLFFIGGYSAKTSKYLRGPAGGWISDLAQDHYTIVGAAYPRGSNWFDGWMDCEVSDCIEHNLSLVYPIVPRRTVTNTKSPKYHGPVGSPICVANINRYSDDEVNDADEQQIDIWIADVEQQIKAVVADPGRNAIIAVWCIMPEEMRYWEKRELELLQRMHDAVKKYDPLQRPTMMYEPQHSSAKRLKKTIPYQDIVSVGIYPHHAGNDHKRIQVRHAMTQIMRAIEETGSDALPIPTLEMFEDTKHSYNPADIPLIPKFVRHDAYCAFANGAKGIFIWSMGRRKGFTTYTDYYNAWANLSKELFELGLRDVFRDGNVLDQTIVDVISGQENIRFQWNKIDETYPSLSIREWSHKQKRYILIVNSSEGSVDFILSNLKNGNYENLFTGSNYVVRGTLSLSLPPLGIIMLQS